MKILVPRICLTILVASLFSSCVNSQKATSSVTKLPQQFVDSIAADGAASDWTIGSVQYNKEIKAFFSVANNTKTMYLILEINDPMQQLKAIRNGITFGFDISGKKRRKATVNYPLPSGNEFGMMQHNTNDGQQDRSALLTRLLAKKNELELSGFNSSLNGVQSLFSSTTGIKAAIKIDADGMMIYELAVPFELWDTKVTFDTPISIDFVINGAEPPSGGGSGGGGGDKMGGPGKGMSSGRPGGKSMGQTSMKDMFVENSFWYKCSFASK